MEVTVPESNSPDRGCPGSWVLARGKMSACHRRLGLHCPNHWKCQPITPHYEGTDHGFARSDPAAKSSACYLPFTAKEASCNKTRNQVLSTAHGYFHHGCHEWSPKLLSELPERTSQGETTSSIGTYHHYESGPHNKAAVYLPLVGGDVQCGVNRHQQRISRKRFTCSRPQSGFE